MHDNLTLVDMLAYAARLRLPDDVSLGERIEKVIHTMELTKHKTP